MSFITAPILQDPEKVAPGSIANLLVTISPSSLAVAFNDNSSATFIFAFNSPEISAFWQFTSPSTIPVEPTTTFPLVLIDPLRVPSTRISRHALRFS